MSCLKFRSITTFFTQSQHNPNSKPPAYLEFRSSTPFILFTVCLAIFTDILFYGLIVPVIPFSLSEQVGLPENKVQHWTAILLACYNAALFLGSPVAGFYADRTQSRRWPFILGLIALCASTLLLCLGKTIVLLVIGRILQGLSAAIVWSVGLALLVDTIGKDIGYAMGYVNIAMSVGLLISPVIGGAVYASAGYYAVYYIAFAVIVCDIALRLVLIEKKVARQWPSGHETETVGVTTPDADSVTRERPEPDERQHAGTRSEKRVEAGDGPAASPSPTGGGSGSDANSPGARLTTAHPHRELFKMRRILAVLLGTVIQAAIVFAFDTVVPLYVKDTFQWNSTAAGLIFICVMVPGFASPLTGMLADRYGARWLSLAGFALSVPPLVCLRFVTSNTLGHKVLMCAMLALLGGTLISLATTPIMAELTYAIEDREAKQPGVWGKKGVYGIAYGLWTMAFALGGTVGSIMAGYINAGPGWGTTTWSFAIWAVVGVFVSLGLGSKRRKKPNARDSPVPTDDGGVVDRQLGQAV
ncbi:hypothetical protein N0V88_000897 [Collariella sp. IMI 366227]|nr:hypothetical protein N0V88_000897 [Collariella sp. IMI 366227]